MTIQCFSENEWIYPDQAVSAPASSVELDAARGGSVCFQILTDQTLDAKGAAGLCVADGQPLRVTVSQLVPARVNRNSARTALCTDDYDSVKDFVTRKAPFDVFDGAREITDGTLAAGRLALHVRVDVPAWAAVGRHFCLIELSCPAGAMRAEVYVRVHKAVVPDLAHARFGMINWLKLERLDKQYGVSKGDPRRTELIRAYLRNQLDMRNTDLMLPQGEPIRDENGELTGFDFADAILVGNMALEMGFHRVMGGFVARFEQWDEPTQYLLWDRKESVVTFKAYGQLKLYFETAWKVACENGWRAQYVQCLVDEPQFPNSEHYRILCGIARKFMPGVVIHDPVESTELYGGPDIWCVKQAVYEKYFDRYQELQKMGEEMWLYTCGFPAGKTLNRVMDLPLAASRLPFWLCALYGCKGFLHWGYNVTEDDAYGITCYRPEPDHPEIAYPAGNAHIVYPGTDGPVNSVRAHLQRAGCEDAELLLQLLDRDPEKAREIIRTIARSFDDYEGDANALDGARRALLDALD